MSRIAQRRRARTTDDPGRVRAEGADQLIAVPACLRYTQHSALMSRRCLRGILEGAGIGSLVPHRCCQYSRLHAVMGSVGSGTRAGWIIRPGRISMGKTRKRPRRVARAEFIEAAGVVKHATDYKAADVIFAQGDTSTTVMFIRK